MSDAVIVLGPSLEVVDANEAAREAFRVDPSHQPALMSVIRSAEVRELLDGLGAESAGRVLRVQDSRYAARASRLPDGRRLLVLRDVTRLEQLERARRDLVANVSHDLRTPLTASRLIVDALEAELDPTDSAGLEHQAGVEASRRVRALRAQLEVIEGLAEGLVELNRLESGRAPFRLAPHIVADLVATAAAPLHVLVAERALDLEVRVDPSLHVLADEDHLVRALRNLLDNACRHSPEGGVVEVGAHQVVDPPEESDEVEMWVADQGPGIAPLERSRIFERFYRGDWARTGVGSGLGLAIVKHVVEGHGGRVWVSDAPTRGARFVLRLLAADTPASPAGD